MTIKRWQKRFHLDIRNNALLFNEASSANVSKELVTFTSSLIFKKKKRKRFAKV